MPLEGRCWASFFAPTGTALVLDAARCTSGWLRWGFCSIRSWLAACRRRVGVLMMQFPPWGDAGQVLEPGCMLCAINFACNSPAALSRFELASLELQRFRRLLKVHATELHAKFLVGVCAFTHGYYSQSPQQGPASRPRS